MKKRRFLAMLLACCMVFGQTVWAQDAEEGQQIVNEEETSAEGEAVQEETVDSNEEASEAEKKNAADAKSETNTKSVSVSQQTEGVEIEEITLEVQEFKYIDTGLGSEEYSNGITAKMEEPGICSRCELSVWGDGKCRLELLAKTEGETMIEVLDKDGTIIKKYHVVAKYKEVRISNDYSFKLDTKVFEYEEQQADGSWSTNNDWEVISEDSSVCEGDVEFERTENWGEASPECKVYVNLHGKNTGSTVVRVRRNGVEECSYRVIVKEPVIVSEEDIEIYVTNVKSIEVDMKKEVYDAGITVNIADLNVCSEWSTYYSEDDEKLILDFSAKTEGETIIDILTKDGIKRYHAVAKYEDKKVYINYPFKVDTNRLFGNVDENAWEFISDNDSVCKGNVEFLNDYDEYERCYINLFGEKEGSTIIKVKKDGIEQFAYRVTVEELPDNVICFKDDALLKALTGEYQNVDTDRDGYITKEELAKVKYLYLNNCGITDLSGLEYAENLTGIDLSGNTELKYVDALLSLPKLESIDIYGTKVPAETRMKLAKFESKIEMAKGDKERLVKSAWGNGEIFDEELQVSVVEGEKDAVVYVDEQLLAKKEGDVVIRIDYKENTLDIPVHVNGIPADQEVGENSDMGLLKTTEDKILSSNGILWETYPEKQQIRENVKDYVADWIYSGRDNVKFEYILDQDGILWSDDQKLAENVEKFTGHYALDKNGVLTDIYNTDVIRLDNVVDMRGVRVWKSYDTENDCPIWDSITYVLKADGTLWRRLEVEKDVKTNAFQLVKENVKEIGDQGYLLESGEYYYYSEVGDAIVVSNMGHIPEDERWMTYYLGNDGNSYIDSSNGFVSVGKVHVIGRVSCERGIIYLTDEGNLYLYVEGGDDELLAESVVEVKNAGMDVVYKQSDGQYRTLEGNTGTPETPLIIGAHYYRGEYWLEDYGVVGDYNLTRNGVLILTHVKKIDGHYAVRTDGTVWDITGIPEMLLDLESSTVVMGDVNGDGKVNIEDLRIILRGVCGKIELTSQQIKAADVVADGKVDIQDLRKELRYVCGKISSLN